MAGYPGQQATYAPSAQKRYATEAASSLSPTRALVALYDRLVLDLDRATAAITARDNDKAHHALVHAQEIVTALGDALDVDAWPEGQGLAAVYDYLGIELVAANLAKDANRVAACRNIVEPMRVTWREAAGLVGTAGDPGGQVA
jgi:flagellar secretion chaperone FliS